MFHLYECVQTLFHSLCELVNGKFFISTISLCPYLSHGHRCMLYIRLRFSTVQRKSEHIPSAKGIDFHEPLQFAHEDLLCLAAWLPFTLNWFSGWEYRGEMGLSQVAINTRMIFCWCWLHIVSGTCHLISDIHIHVRYTVYQFHWRYASLSEFHFNSNDFCVSLHLWFLCYHMKVICAPNFVIWWHYVL